MVWVRHEGQHVIYSVVTLRTDYDVSLTCRVSSTRRSNASQTLMQPLTRSSHCSATFRNERLKVYGPDPGTCIPLSAVRNTRTTPLITLSPVSSFHLLHLSCYYSVLIPTFLSFGYITYSFHARQERV